jgi:hypothetical protein
MFRLRVLSINRIRCAIRGTDGCFPSAHFPKYYVVNVSPTIRKTADILIIQDPAQRFWVIPTKDVKPLVYLPLVLIPHPTRGARSRWLPYLERWDLLTKGLVP